MSLVFWLRDAHVVGGPTAIDSFGMLWPKPIRVSNNLNRTKGKNMKKSYSYGSQKGTSKSVLVEGVFFPKPVVSPANF